MTVIASFINFIFYALTLAIIVYAFTSFFLQPYHPVRRALSFIDSLLDPIRRVIPPIAGLDFSPLILILLLQLLQTVIVNLILSLR